jgi:uncharacterized protein (DUF2147 family)
MAFSKFTLIFILIIGKLFAQSKADDIIGKWLTEKNEAVIQIFKTSNNHYAGKIIWLKEPLDNNGKPKTDIKNPKPELRNRPIMNLVILAGFEFDGKEWINGIIYDAETGNTYKAKISMENYNKLILRGYIGSPIFGRSTTWTRRLDK